MCGAVADTDVDGDADEMTERVGGADADGDTVGDAVGSAVLDVETLGVELAECDPDADTDGEPEGFGVTELRLDALRIEDDDALTVDDAD